jgi:competence protein ComEA
MQKQAQPGFTRVKLIAASALISLPFFVAAAQTDNAKPGPSAADANLLPDGPGKDLVLKKCTSCHNTRNVIASSRTADDWAQEVSKMVGRGATISDDEADTIVNYLADHFGPDSPKAGEPSQPAQESKPQK